MGQSEKENMTTIMSYDKKGRNTPNTQESKAVPGTEFQKKIFIWDFVQRAFCAVVNTTFNSISLE